MRESSSTLGERDARTLRRFERLVAAVVVALVAARGRDDAWPFIVWPMYASTHPTPPRRVSETELRLVSRDGDVRRLLPPQVFTHVELELARRVATQAFVEGPDRERYRTVLLRRLAPLLEEHDVVEVEGWTLGWTTDPMAVPPFDRARPDQEILLGGLRPLDERR
jgi:hypothetical protein